MSNLLLLVRYRIISKYKSEFLFFLAIQVVLGARIQKEFNVTSEELEFAIVLQHENLQSVESICL
jgi:hypothetical protein